MRARFVVGGVLLAAAAFAPSAATADGFRSGGYVAPHIWTGLYVGGHVGYAWSDMDWALDYPFAAPPASSSFNNDGAIAGGHLGYQHQFGQWVVGVEVSLTGGFDKDTLDGINLFAASTAGVLRTDIDWMLLATARVGYAWDRWLAYVKGGYAGAMIELHTDDNVPPDYVSTSRKLHSGWTVGVGAEYMVASGVMLGIEYNYVNLGADPTTPVFDEVSTAQVGTAFSDVDTEIHSVMARLSFKLGPVGTTPLK
jgi:outer membrane immunogenic protein